MAAASGRPLCCTAPGPKAGWGEGTRPRTVLFQGHTEGSALLAATCGRPSSTGLLVSGGF